MTRDVKSETDIAVLKQILDEKRAVQELRRTVTTAKDACFGLLTQGVPREVVERMEKSVDFATACIRDPDPNVRSAALVVLTHSGNPDGKRLTDIVINCIANDTDVGVREQALACIGRLHRYTANESVSAFLVSLIERESESVQLRVAAYTSLIEIADCGANDGLSDQARSIGTLENCVAYRFLCGTFRFPEDIDQSLLSRFR